MTRRLKIGISCVITLPALLLAALAIPSQELPLRSFHGAELVSREVVPEIRATCGVGFMANQRPPKESLVSTYSIEGSDTLVNRVRAECAKNPGWMLDIARPGHLVIYSAFDERRISAWRDDTGLWEITYWTPPKRSWVKDQISRLRAGI